MQNVDWQEMTLVITSLPLASVLAMFVYIHGCFRFYLKERLGCMLDNYLI